VIVEAAENESEDREATMTRELDYRTNNGLEVVLQWDCRSRNLTVEVHDAVSGDEFTFPVDAAHALDAFRHPFAYAAHRGLPYAAAA
jgi:hypothetical protein